MIDQDKLNRTEQWIAEHSIRIFAVVAVVMVAAALFTIRLVVEQGEVQEQVDVLRPKVTRVIRAASVCNAEALEREDASRACAGRLRIALINCRSHPSCRAAFLATLNVPTAARRGVVSSNPSETGSQPAPPPGGAHKGGRQPRQKRQPKSSSPPAQADPAPLPTDTTPGNSPESGHGVKACVDLAVSACAKAELP